MATILELVAKITGEVSGFTREMDRGAKSTSDFAAAWTKAGRDVSTAAMRMGSIVGATMGGIAAATVKIGVSFNKVRQSAETDFGVMLGNMAEGKKLVEQITDVAARTPLRQRDLLEATSMLLNYNVAAGDVLPMLQRIGDTAGGNAEKFKSMALAYGQAWNLGKFQMNDARQMIGSGFNPSNEIMKRTGESADELQDRMSKGLISAQEMRQAFIDATSEGGRFFNRMNEQSKTLVGATSSLQDNIDMTAGKLTESINGALERIAKSINQILDRGDLNAWIKNMQQAIGGVVDEIERFIAQNGKAAVRGIGDAFLWAARGAVQVAAGVRESWPEIKKTATEWAAFLRPVAQWIAENPKMVAGIAAAGVAFKGLQLLGVVSAFTSMIGALRSTIGLMSTLPTVLASVGGAMAALQAGGILIIIGGIAALLVHMQRLKGSWYELEAQLKDAKDSDDLLAARETDRHEAILNKQYGSNSERQSVLGAELEMAKKNAAGAAASYRGAKKTGQESVANAPENEKAAIAQVASAEVNEARGKMERADAWVKQLEAALGTLSTGEWAGKAGTEVGKAASAEIVSGTQEAGHDFLAEAKEKGDSKGFDKFLLKHRDDQRESKFDGYNNIRDALEYRGPAEKVQQFAASQKGVSPELAAEFAQLYAESDKSAESLDQLALALARTVKEQKDFEKRADTVGDKLEDFQEKLNDLRGAVPAKELQGFMQQFNYLGEQFKAKAIDSDQYRDGLKNLTNRIKDSGQAAQQSKSVDGDVSQARRKLLNSDGPEWTGQKAALGMVNDETRRAAFGKLDGIEAESQRLGAAFKSGEISAAQYAAAVDRLKRSTNEVTEAALAEDQAKRRQALLRGDFKGAGLDFGKAVEDKVADQQMRAFDQMVNDYIGNFFQLNQFTQSLNENFDALSGQVTKFGTDLGKSIGGFVGGGSGGQTDPAAVSWFNSWLSSVQGQATQIANMIGMHQQALSFLSDPQRRQQEIDAINSLVRELQILNKSVSTFSGYRSYDPIFRDPGISGTGQNTVLNNTINVAVPSMVSASQSEIDHLANRISDSLARQGNQAFRG